MEIAVQPIRNMLLPNTLMQHSTQRIRQGLLSLEYRDGALESFFFHAGQIRPLALSLSTTAVVIDNNTRKIQQRL